MKIHYSHFEIHEEDDLAQVQEIFNHFDFGHNGRVKTADLPNILRLLEHNIGKIEEKELMYEIDRKNKGYFTIADLATLLTNIGFKEDTSSDLIKSLQELDEDADGFIKKSEFETILSTIGEALDKDEMKVLRDIATEPHSKRPDLVDIKRLASILVPPKE